MFLLGCNKNEKISRDKLDLSILNVDTVKNNSILNFIKVEVDSFRNDTTYSIGDIKSTFASNDSRFLYTKLWYKERNLMLDFFINKRYSDENLNHVNFKFEDGSVEHSTVRTFNTSNLSLLSWEVWSKDEYTLLKKLANSDKVLFGINDDTDTYMYLSKSQINSIKLFCSFIELYGFNKFRKKYYDLNSY